MKRFSIVGAGRLGTSLGAALVKRGWRIEAIVDRDARAARESRGLLGAGRASTSFAAAAGASGAVIIAVPDGSVARVAAGLARAAGAWRGRNVFQTSGLLPASVLGPLAARGAKVASLHPVQSFPRKDMPASAFEGITWGIEGEEGALEAAAAIVRALRGRVLLLSAEDKPSYHAACALASNALVALESTAAEVLGRAGLEPEMAAAALLPLVQGTLQNVKSLGLGKALSGPVIRGDAVTVKRHLEALRADPEALEIYRVLGLRILRLAGESGLGKARLNTLRRLLEGKRPLPRGRCRTSGRPGP
jgi:predicted short-subunit dehydrogenase-like oxidoreductase (DUF2520 family)